MAQRLKQPLVKPLIALTLQTVNLSRR
ncbi:UNVERIFIED_CONTAM: hypothetical protein GTU68_004404 [Idotea baltica]|nr:hypothetical protein [Idotea baltica]